MTRNNGYLGQLLAAPVWVSGFRPFYLAAVIYGPLVLLVWPLEWIGGAGPLPHSLWHGHEMVFGFAAAIVAGFVLTALPGWAGTEEIGGGRLALLALAWLAGRLAYWGQTILPLGAAGAIDSAFFLLLALIVAPGLLRVEQRLYLLLLPILAGFFVADLFYWQAVADADFAAAGRALQGAVYTLMVLFTFVGGFLTPIFTENALRERGWEGRIPFSIPLETAAVVATALYGASLVAQLPPAVTGGVALLAAVVHGARMARWRSWSVRSVPVVFVMHVGYLWLIATFAARALGDLTDLIAGSVALHVFTVGAFGIMKMGLMTRVVLKHTGRPVAPGVVVVLAYWLMLGAALLRLAGGVTSAVTGLIGASVLLWIAATLIYLYCYGGYLVRPSLPQR